MKSLPIKILVSLIFFEFYIRGGKEHHYLPLNENQRTNLRRNLRLRDIMETFGDLTSSHKFNIVLIVKYVKTARVAPSVFEQFKIIMNSFESINTQRWQEKVMDYFIDLTRCHFDITLDMIYDRSDIRIVTPIKEKTQDAFISEFLYYGVLDVKKKVDELYYGNLIYVLSIITSIRGNSDFNITEYYAFWK